MVVQTVHMLLLHGILCGSANVRTLALTLQGTQTWFGRRWLVRVS